MVFMLVIDRRMMKLMAFLAASAAVVLSGCATSVPKIDVVPGALAPVATITVVRPPEPKKYAVINFGHPGMAFGAIGGLIAAGDEASKQERLSQGIRQDSPTIVSSTLVDELAQMLRRKGFQVDVEDGAWVPLDSERLEFKVERVRSTADAVLVVNPTIVGFIATGITADYEPTVAAVVSLLGKDRKTELYRGYHLAGWEGRGDQWRRSPARTSFPNFDAMAQSPHAAAMGLRSAAADVAKTVGEDLRR